MTPSAFCAAIREDLARLNSDDASARGARGLCDWYAGADAERFELILNQVARGSASSAVAEGARWLLPRWRDRRDSD